MIIAKKKIRSVFILKEFREKYGLSRGKKAELLEIYANTLSDWEYRNKSIPNGKIKNVERIFKVYIEKLEGKKPVVEIEDKKEVVYSESVKIDDKLNVIFERLKELSKN